MSVLVHTTLAINMKTIEICGYNPNQWLGIWKTSFNDDKYSLVSLFFKENGPIYLFASHPSLAMFLTVSQTQDSNLILLYHETDNGLIHAGHYFEKEPIIAVNWLDSLPLFVILTKAGSLNVIGPAIDPISEDIRSFTSMLSYSMNTHCKYKWKICYKSNVTNEVISMLHIATFHIDGSDKYKEFIIIILKNELIFLFINIMNILNLDDLEIQTKIKGKMKFTGIKSIYLLKAPENIWDSFKICIHRENIIV